MKYHVYILLSSDKLHWYIGSTNNLEDRLKRHNSGRSKYTKPFKPWQIVYHEEYKTRSEAVKREFYLKSPKGYHEYLSIKSSIKTGEVA